MSRFSVETSEIAILPDVDATTAPTSQSEIILRPGRGKMIGYLIVCAVFVVMGVTASRGVLGWLSTSFFGLGVVVFAAQLLPRASYLRMTRDGFVCCSLFRKSPLISWREVSSFRVATVPPNQRMVVYDWEGASRQGVRRLNRALVGATDGLPDTYGMKPQ